MFHPNAVKLAAIISASIIILVGTPAFAEAKLEVSVGGRLDGGFPFGSTPTLAIGATGVFGVTVKNIGDVEATEVTLTPAMPAGTKITGLLSMCTKEGKTSACVVDADLPFVLDAGLAAGAKAAFEFQFKWPVPATLPTVCSTNLGLSVEAKGSNTIAASGSNDGDVTVPLADISGVVSGPGEPVADGGIAADRPVPGQTITYKGTVTNNGPCAVPADSLALDSMSSSYGLEFVSGTGCAPWSTPDGVCTVAAVLAKGDKLDFTIDATIMQISDAGGDSIIQTASGLTVDIAYDGNPGMGTVSPSTTTLVKGPATSFSVGGEGLMTLSLLMSGLALWNRRRQA